MISEKRTVGAPNHGCMLATSSQHTYLSLNQQSYLDESAINLQFREAAGTTARSLFAPDKGHRLREDYGHVIHYCASKTTQEHCLSVYEPGKHIIPSNHTQKVRDKQRPLHWLFNAVLPVFVLWLLFFSGNPFFSRCSQCSVSRSHPRCPAKQRAALRWEGMNLRR